MPRQYIVRSKEEKMAIVEAVLKGASTHSWEKQGIRHKQVLEWTKKYSAAGEDGLESKKKPGNPLSRYERRKELSYEERLQYQIEILKRELVKKDAELLRSKKLNGQKGGDARKN